MYAATSQSDTIIPLQRLKGAARFSGLSPLQPIIDLDHLPLGPTELLQAIGRRLLELAELAHGHEFEAETQAENLGALARELGERSFEQMKVTEIASRAGISVGGFYARFKAKDALLDYLNHGVIGGIVDRVVCSAPFASDADRAAFMEELRSN